MYGFIILRKLLGDDTRKNILFVLSLLYVNFIFICNVKKKSQICFTEVKVTKTLCRNLKSWRSLRKFVPYLGHYRTDICRVASLGKYRKPFFLLRISLFSFHHRCLHYRYCELMLYMPIFQRLFAKNHGKISYSLPHTTLLLYL